MRSESDKRTETQWQAPLPLRENGLKDRAIRELAHVARELLIRIEEIDKDTPKIFIEALRNKIEYYDDTWEE